MNILILNGPNLNKLGQRDPEQYGSETLADTEQFIANRFPGHTFQFIQSNREGALIDAIQSADKNFDGVIANFAGFSHTSVAIRDALELVKIPKIEVHLSNVYSRESFRHDGITAAMANGVIAGFGKNSYVLAVHALEAIKLN